MSSKKRVELEPVWVKRLGNDGSEILDPRPVAIPVHLNRPPTRYEEFRKYLRLESRMAESRGFESLEESDDFDVDDEFDPSSPYEEDFDHVSNAEQDKRAYAESRKKKSTTPRQPAPMVDQTAKAPELAKETQTTK